MPNETSAGQARGSGRLLVAAPFGPFFWGKVAWTAGVWVHSVVAAILAYEVTGSALFVGLVTAAQFIPQLFFTPAAGAMADRGNMARQIVWGRVISAAGSGALAVTLLVTGQDSVPRAAILASSFLVGIGLVVGGPAVQSIVPSLVRPDELATAVALNSLPLLVARAAAPAIGAFVSSTLGPATALALAAAGSIVFAVTVLLLRLPDPPLPGPGHDLSMRAVFRYVRTERPIALLLLGVTAVGFGADPSMTLTPAIAADLGGGTELVGWLGAAFGLGAAAGFLPLSWLRRRFGLEAMAPAGLLTMALSLVVPAASSTVHLALASFLIGGVGMTLALTSITTLLHERCPDRLRGRVMALWLMGFIGSRPLAGAVDGFLADAFSVPVSLLTVAAVTLAGAAVCRPGTLGVPGRQTAQASAGSVTLPGNRPR